MSTCGPRRGCEIRASVVQWDTEHRTLLATRGAPHGFEAAAEEAHLLVTVRPRLELGGYFRAFMSLSREDRLRIPPRGFPKPLLLVAALMHRYRREIAAPGIPVWLQRPLWRVLALLGRLRGRRVD